MHRDRGRFEWGVLDEVVEFAEELGLQLVADLVHYGTPSWLPGSFADPGYPDAVAEFAGAFATRYRGRVRHYTPLNEPVTTASFCGLRGVWPPRLTGWPGWVAVVVPVVEGMARTTRAIRAADPDAVIVHVEAATNITTDDPAPRGPRRTAARRRLAADRPAARSGRSPIIRCAAWLIEQGADRQRLDALLADPAVPDVVGVNYYPDLTPRRLVSSGDDILQVSYDRGALGLREAVLAFRDRYGLPLAITETSIEGTDAVRGGWLRRLGRRGGPAPRRGRRPARLHLVAALRLRRLVVGRGRSERRGVRRRAPGGRLRRAGSGTLARRPAGGKVGVPAPDGAGATRGTRRRRARPDTDLRRLRVHAAVERRVAGDGAPDDGGLRRLLRRSVRASRRRPVLRVRVRRGDDGVAGVRGARIGRPGALALTRPGAREAPGRPSATSTGHRRSPRPRADSGCTSRWDTASRGITSGWPSPIRRSDRFATSGST